MKTLTKKQIIEETLKYYKTHRRGINISSNGNHCQYLTKKGSMCAVGRCLINPQKAMDKKIGGVHGFYDERTNEKILDSMLKPGYIGHDYTFWSGLQTFHDSNDNWEKQGRGNKLTDEGLKNYNRLLKTYE
jgi:hypothetical protein